MQKPSSRVTLGGSSEAGALKVLLNQGGGAVREDLISSYEMHHRKSGPSCPAEQCREERHGDVVRNAM